MLKLSVLMLSIFVADTFSQIQPGVPRRARRDIGSPEANSLSADEDKSSIPVADDLTLPNTEVPSENVDSKDSNASTGELGTIHGFGPHHRVTRQLGFMGRGGRGFMGPGRGLQGGRAMGNRRGGFMPRLGGRGRG